jgi:coenzyme F420-reducing hydrogenase gamma subunit
MKKKVGIFSFTCDEGCSIFLIEIFNKKLLTWLEKMELSYFLSVRDHREIDKFDIILVEGVIATENDVHKIKKLRAAADILIAMGSCAVNGQPSAQRNNFNAEQIAEIRDRLAADHYLPKILTLKEVVKVDDQILGCPINERKFIEVFEKYLN